MRRKSFETMSCPIARSLERVGEWWSILILRDAFRGATRFEQFQKSLDIAPNMLTRRLNALVESGLMERRRYSDHPPRDEYVLTDRGRDFRPVMWALLAWGNRHFAPEGPNVVIVDGETGELADPVLMDRRTLRPLTDPPFRSVHGPAAAEAIRRHQEKTPPPLVGGGGGEGCEPRRTAEDRTPPLVLVLTPPPHPLPQGEGESVRPAAGDAHV